MYRQGDILIAPVESIPEGAQPLPRENGLVVLARGEVAGHTHAIRSENATLFQPTWGGELRFLKVVATSARLEHEEHAAICLPPGAYRVIRQREYESRMGGGVYVAD